MLLFELFVGSIIRRFSNGFIGFRRHPDGLFPGRVSKSRAELNFIYSTSCAAVNRMFLIFPTATVPYAIKPSTGHLLTLDGA
jgi:hypothetical protein